MVFHCNYWDCSCRLGCTYNASWPVTLRRYGRMNRKHLMLERQCQQMLQQLFFRCFLLERRWEGGEGRGLDYATAALVSRTGAPSGCFACSVKRAEDWGTVFSFRFNRLLWSCFFFLVCQFIWKKDLIAKIWMGFKTLKTVIQVIFELSKVQLTVTPLWFVNTPVFSATAQ